MQKLRSEFTPRDVLCCVTTALMAWERNGKEADAKNDEVNTEARKIGYPEID